VLAGPRLGSREPGGSTLLTCTTPCADLGAGAEDGAREHGDTGGQEASVFDAGAVRMGVRADQHVRVDLDGVPRPAADQLRPDTAGAQPWQVGMQAGG
jgi:hypothetical protein